MSKNVKNVKKNRKRKFSAIDSSDSSLTIRSLQISLNYLSNQFESLKDDDFILRQRIKSKMFANPEINLKKIINDNHLINIVNSKTSVMKEQYQNLNHKIFISKYSFRQEMIESIAKEAILIFKNLREYKIPKS